MRLSEPDLLGDVAKVIAIGDKLFSSEKPSNTPTATSGSTNKKNNSAAAKNDALANKAGEEAESIRQKRPGEVSHIDAQTSASRALGSKHGAETLDALSSRNARNAKLPLEKEELKAKTKKAQAETKGIEQENRAEHSERIFKSLHDALGALPPGTPLSEINKVIDIYQKDNDENGMPFDFLRSLSGDGGYRSIVGARNTIDNAISSYKEIMANNNDADIEDLMDSFQTYKDELLINLQGNPRISKMVDRGEGGRKKIHDIIPGVELRKSLPKNDPARNSIHDDYLYVELMIEKPDGSTYTEIMTKGRGTAKGGDNTLKHVPLRELRQDLYGQEQIVAGLKPLRDSIVARGGNEGYSHYGIGESEHESNLKIGDGIASSAVNAYTDATAVATANYNTAMNALNEEYSMLNEGDVDGIENINLKVAEINRNRKRAMAFAAGQRDDLLSVSDTVRRGKNKPLPLGGRAIPTAPAQQTTAPASAPPAPVSPDPAKKTANNQSLSQIVESEKQKKIEASQQNEARQTANEDAIQARRKQQQYHDSVLAESANKSLDNIEQISAAQGRSSIKTLRAAIASLNAMFKAMGQDNGIRNAVISRYGSIQKAEQALKEMMARINGKVGERY